MFLNKGRLFFRPSLHVAASSSKKGADEDDAESKQKKRLKILALDNQLLSDSPAKSNSSLKPSKQVLKHHGTDIIRKSQRKNRFFFFFPGLLAPISRATIDDFDRLSTKNPVLYLNFPQGRMKLFGTILYPKNRYLTLQFSRGGKNVLCDDYFDNMNQIYKWKKQEWNYDINLVTWSAGVFYGYVTIVPLALYVVLKYFSAPSGLVQLFCLYEVLLAWLKSPSHEEPMDSLRLIAAQAEGLFPLLDREIRNTCLKAHPEVS